MIKEMHTNNPITSEGQPDGNSVLVIDPYEGCNIGCPYCFRLSDEGWLGRTIACTNIAEMLDEILPTHPKEEMYVGSLCDPYISEEKDYELTRKCLKVLSKHQMPTFITTKSDNELILRDIDIFKNFNSDLTILVGISHMQQLRNAYNGFKNNNLELANRLHNMGITVWASITPIMPYIVPVEKMVNEINADIPILLDLLRVEKPYADTIQAEYIKKYIGLNFPHLTQKYNSIIDDGNLDYYYELKEKYKNDKRITFLHYNCNK